MVRWITAAVFLAAALTNNCQILSDPPDVRNVRWGMSKAQVMDTEDAPPTEDRNNALAYHHTIAGEEAGVSYRFMGDALVEVALEYWGIVSEDYHVELARILTSKYGAPIEQQPSQDDDWHEKKWITPRTIIRYYVRKYESLEGYGIRLYYEPTQTPQDLEDSRDLF